MCCLVQFIVDVNQVNLPYSSLLYLVFCLLILSTVERRVLKSPTLNAEQTISPSSFTTFCSYILRLCYVHIYLEFYTFLLHSFIIIKCLSVSLVSLFILQYIFTDIIIVTLTFLYLFSMEENHPTLSCCHYQKMQLF